MILPVGLCVLRHAAEGALCPLPPRPSRRLPSVLRRLIEGHVAELLWQVALVHPTLGAVMRVAIAGAMGGTAVERIEAWAVKVP